MTAQDQHIGFVGCGLIGTSILDMIAAAAPDTRFTVLETNPAYVEMLKERHRAITFAGGPDALAACPLIFVCTPTSTVAGIVCDLIPLIGDASLIVDVASVKVSVVDQVRAAHAGFSRFVPGHPLGGRRTAGPAEAGRDVLAGRPFILTPYEATDPDAVEDVRRFLERIGFRVSVAAADEHDRFVALTSHLTHLIAYALVDRFYELSDQSAAESERTFEDHMAFIGPSFLQVGHFAASDPTMWVDIFLDNRDMLRQEFAAFSDAAGRLSAALDDLGKPELVEMMQSLKLKQEKLEKLKNED